MHTDFKITQFTLIIISALLMIWFQKSDSKVCFAMQFVQTFRWSKTKYKEKIIHWEAKVSLWRVTCKINVDTSSSRNLCKSPSNRSFAAYCASCLCHSSKTLLVSWWQTSGSHQFPTVRTARRVAQGGYYLLLCLSPISQLRFHQCKTVQVPSNSLCQCWFPGWP